MAVEVERARRLFTVEEYHRMGETGILKPSDRVELIRGEIIEMSPIGRRHVAFVNNFNQLLVIRLAGRAIVSVQNPVVIADDSEPQPDLALLRCRAVPYKDAEITAADVLLLIELAETSLRYDRTVKLRLYAEAGVPIVPRASPPPTPHALVRGRRRQGPRLSTRASRPSGGEPRPGAPGRPSGGPYRAYAHPLHRHVADERPSRHRPAPALNLVDLTRCDNAHDDLRRLSNAKPVSGRSWCSTRGHTSCYGNAMNSSRSISQSRRIAARRSGPMISPSGRAPPSRGRPA